MTAKELTIMEQSSGHFYIGLDIGDTIGDYAAHCVAHYDNKF
jgi:hypothetical protein